MPALTTGKKITLKTLEKHLNSANGVPIPKTGNLKKITSTALARVYDMHLKGEVKFKTDTQDRIKAYAKDYIPQRGRPRKDPIESEVIEVEAIEVEAVETDGE